MERPCLYIWVFMNGKQEMNKSSVNTNYSELVFRHCIDPWMIRVNVTKKDTNIQIKWIPCNYLAKYRVGLMSTMLTWFVWQSYWTSLKSLRMIPVVWPQSLNLRRRLNGPRVPLVCYEDWGRLSTIFTQYTIHSNITRVMFDVTPIRVPDTRINLNALQKWSSISSWMYPRCVTHSAMISL